MANNLIFNGSSSFRIKRPLITTNGFVSDVDLTIQSHLKELNTLLGKRIIPRELADEGDGASPEELLEHAVEDIIEATANLGEETGGGGRTATRSFSNSGMISRLKEVLRLELTPKRVPGNDWAQGSLLAALKQQKESNDRLTLSDYIDMTAELSELKYAFESYLSANWFTLDYNTKAVLDGYPAIRDYLIAYGFHIMDVEEINGLRNFIFSNRAGAKNIANYAIVSAARTIIDQEKLKVPNYNQDNSEIVSQIKAAGLSLSSASFKTALQKLIDDYIFNDRESRLIEGAGIGTLPVGIKPLLVKYIKHSPVPITEENVKFFLPLFISQIVGKTEISTPTEVDVEESDKDFTVDFLEDDNSFIQISRSAVKCAAQLFYGMVLGDELDVFDTVNYFTHKYLIRGNIEIQDSRLREDLQMYVFSNRFTDPKTQKILDRTRPAERQMFYRQVFDQGNAPLTDDFVLNKEFPRLWKVLVLESAKYLERAQASFNPDSYVSRQNVMQAVEDLQYNLSTHCTGMVNVITPLIYTELHFVIQRIFMHPEILRQVVPSGGTWWRVVETLYMEMKHMRPKATVLYNKAKLGYEIIRSIADYNPATFEDDKNFSSFISNVDAFITTQSILQEALTDDLKLAEKDANTITNTEQNGARTPMPETAVGTAPGTKSSNDEWDF